MIAHSSFIGLESVSIADALTATNIQIGVPGAHGLIVPVSQLAGGSTIAFYFRNDLGYQQGITSVFLDARDVLNGTSLGYTDEGPLAGAPRRFFTDGFDVSGYPTNVILANTARERWSQAVIRVENVPRAAGFLYVGMNSVGEQYQPLKLADFRIYDYAVSLAQISAPLLPFDYVTRLTFAGYQPGDAVAADVSGNGNDAAILS